MRLVTQKEARSLFGGGGTFLGQFAQRLARVRGTHVPVSVVRALPPGQELGAWSELFGTFELEVADPAEAELRSPTPAPSFEAHLDPRNPSWVAEIVGLFTASTVVAQQEAMSFLASWVGAKDGASRVYYFHPGDWGVWPTDASIAARMFRLLQEEDRPEHEGLRFTGHEEARLTSALKLYEAVSNDALPETSDPGLLFQRSEWLVGALTGAGRSFSVSVAKAAPVARFVEEADLVARLPHIALYWLLAHFFLENRHELDVALSLSESLPDPIVQDVRQWLMARGSRAQTKLGGLDHGTIEALRVQISEVASVELFGADRRRAVLSNRARALTESEEQARIRAPLVEAASNDLQVREVLALLDHLCTGGSVQPGRVHGLDTREAMRRLADRVDIRFKELLHVLLRRSALYADTHHGAGWGLILAWASIASDFSEFESVLDEIGTARFGPRRRAELYEAYGRFPDARATERLAAAAERWLTQVDDWIRYEPEEAVYVLLRRDVLATHQFIARLLEQANFSFANVNVCVEASRTAGRLRSSRAVPGLRRAIRHRLGRLGDGGRTDVNVALAQVEGIRAAPFFEEVVGCAVTAWESAEDEDESWSRQADLACHLAGARISAPSHPRYVELTQGLAEHLRLRLRPQSVPSPETLEVATALVTGASAGEDSRLTRFFDGWSHRFRRTPGNRNAAVRFDQAWQRMQERLRS
ncbi:MAG: hypothetical protein ACFB9M_09340 [Myxococcota bacterium]